MGDETSMGGKETRFQSTVWDVVRQAKEGRREATEQLVADYWKPVYFYVRRRGHDVESAKDLTQSFFGAFLEKDYLKFVSPELGRFRSFIMASLGHFLSNERDRASAAKRGGGMNFVQAEADLVAADPAPDKAFFKGWALSILERAMERLRGETPPEDIALLGGTVPETLSLSEKKNRLHRVRARLREHVRDLIRPSVEKESEIESEVRELFSALR
jgi:RNA polymerase sigma-70 factor (ECF subfamily)